MLGLTIPGRVITLITDRTITRTIRGTVITAERTITEIEPAILFPSP